MKMLHIALRAAMVCVFTLCIVSCSNRARQQDAIIKVFSENAQAGAKLHGIVGRTNQQEAMQTYVQKLQAIDCSSCPKDFRLAWSDFVSAAAEMHSNNIAATKKLLETKQPDHRLQQEALEHASELRESFASCFRRCQQIALSYGVKVDPIAKTDSR
jgi:hypothetical protein